MPNPWLTVPLADYEGHMGPEGVHQLEALASLFARALSFAKPASVAVLGVAGGNGLDRVDPAITRRLVALDINLQYLDAVRTRYARLNPELHLIDLAAAPLPIPPVDLVHAALIFEHAGTGRCLDNALSLVKPHGRLSVVLQLPSDSAPEVSPSRYPSIATLRYDFHLIPPAELRALVEPHGFTLELEEGASVPFGKSLWLGVFVSQA